MYKPFRLGDSHPLYTYPPVTDFPTWWLYANIGRMSSVVVEKEALNLTKQIKNSKIWQNRQVVIEKTENSYFQGK